MVENSLPVTGCKTNGIMRSVTDWLSSRKVALFISIAAIRKLLKPKIIVILSIRGVQPENSFRYHSGVYLAWRTHTYTPTHSILW